MKRFE